VSAKKPRKVKERQREEIKQRGGELGNVQSQEEVVISEECI
jgi:hypothetical protein